MKKIPYNRQFISSEDIKEVSFSLKKNLITTGPYVNKFENQLKKKLQVKHAVSCSSGTSALHLALMSIDLKKNDIVIIPSINFIAAYNMAKLMEASIFLADVDPCLIASSDELHTSTSPRRRGIIFGASIPIYAIAAKIC